MVVVAAEDVPTGPIPPQEGRPSTRRPRLLADVIPLRVPRRGPHPAAGATLLNERYELVGVLGSGGMGTVHRAVDHRLGRTVAIKVLSAGGEGTDGYRRRLQAEAAILASLRHESVARVFDYDEDRGSRRRTPFLVMELVEGITLSRLLADRGPMSVEQTFALVRDVASTLTYLNDCGIVHRDLKPSNLMLTVDGRVVLVDFGIAHAPSSDTLTTTGALLGTVDYVSPEQVGGQAATHASDLYALGLIAHHCLTGSSPFRRDNPIASAYAQIHEPLPDLPDEVPADGRALVQALASKSPVERPPTAASVVERATPLAGDLPPIEAIAPTVDDAPSTETAATAVGTALVGRRRVPALVALGAAALVVATAGVAVPSGTTGAVETSGIGDLPAPPTPTDEPVTEGGTTAPAAVEQPATLVATSAEPPSSQAPAPATTGSDSRPGKGPGASNAATGAGQNSDGGNGNGKKP